ncbi:MAG: hypothetical protein JRG77_09910, partial [Deltaproteobacteria bacterium]|nr:hypothetical protein [Deltaproteobacteria bacterium]MBW2099082.1 hypothetical protein [Deltaproteobacteria bacterium]
QFKETAREIIADRVRGTARGFWEKMGFSDMGNGNYRWVINQKRKACRLLEQKPYNWE